MELKAINQQELDNFVSKQPNSQILQSGGWNKFQKSVGHQTWSFGVFDNNKIIASALVIENRLPLTKSYLYCPRGPVTSSNLDDKEKTEALELILSKARSLTIDTKPEEIFFRLEPIFELLNSKIAPSKVEGPKLIKTTCTQPSDTLILNLAPSADELLAEMHQKTRYNIRLAEKNGVKISKAEAASFDKIWPLFEQTSSRDDFGIHSKNYYQKMLDQVPQIELWQASYNNDIIAANIISFFGDTATYLHGASNHKMRQIMAPSLLQWEVIKEAKNRGLKQYDFYGIAPSDDKSHPWHGLTRFKKGFGGKIASYPGTFDFIYEPGWYKLYKLLRKINRLIKK